MANIQEGRRTADRRAAVQGLIADVGRTFKELRCVGSQRLVKLGISMQHLQALTMLQHHGPQTMTRLAEMLDVSLSNATGIVDRLEDRGFVERVRVKDDRRIVLVQPTPAADAVMEHLDVLRSAMLEEALARLDDDRLEVVEAGLRAFRDALQTELDVHPDRYSHGPVSPNPDHVGTIPADSPTPRTAPLPAPASI
jgi:DNA-binding MarR family transcriptional regulator